jgi:alkanesulfonate monooxygenase SsuD/methylene tetrahydromethanopterin reductase-like flavin-dependent oxidoreductase (luciferase family)
VLGSTYGEAVARKAEQDDQLDLETLKEQLAVLLEVPASALDLAKELPYDKIPVVDSREGAAGHVRRAKVVESARERGLTAKTVLLEYVTGGHRVVVGTPEQVADDLTD